MLTGSGLSNLVPHQLSTLRLMAQGYDNQAIAAELTLTVKTVENYVNQISEALGLSEIPGRHKRVLAALGYHYSLNNVHTLKAITRFIESNDALVQSLADYQKAHREFTDACAAMEILVGVTITPRVLMEEGDN